MGMLLRRHYPQKPAESELVTYDELTVKELQDVARERDVKGSSTLNKEELIAVLLEG